ncbi:MAG TPA: ShlB/FhaC/HecB family hemolysin secretion/activation protein [Leptolyngbyaceae cyanobacterium M33_DOE_097]|uniref:ShlB/FhaC/HecB family hemolysin secretion/activation protein n=1 Tax=Oscillatoriales cyanobacterium SpSt-418 TaxID=2282169 RepID=A0A7C3KHA3_9CYAN|nr:ShlB/FhaC/HecB family hemolysin secretion/activation protein [Leptolyngbyaceae cyanobacterium M33_DOE_097]
MKVNRLCSSHYIKFYLCFSFVLSYGSLTSQAVAQSVSAPSVQNLPLSQTPSPNSPQINSPILRQGEPPSSQPLPESPPPQPIPPPEELLPLPPTTPGEAEPSLDSVQTVVVKRFKVTGSTVFSEAQLAEVTKPFLNRPITLAELFQARTAVTQFYIDRGYITSGAYIPPQTLAGEDIEVEIRVVEGSLEDIRVTGTRRLKPGYISSRIGLKTQKPLNRDQLLEALQLLQLDPLLESISAELSAGTRPGESLLEVQVKEARAFDLPIILDNGRSPSVGTFRRQAQVIHNNLLGYGDRLFLGYTNTDGSNAGDFSYTIPVSPRNTTLTFSFGLSDSNVIEEPFNVLDIESKSQYFEFTVRHPVVQKPSREFAVGLTFTQRYSEATLFTGTADELPFPALGADADGITRLSAIRFFQDAVWRSSNEVIALRSQFSIGLDIFNATINDTPPDSQFFAWRGQAQWVRLLGPDTLLLLRGDVQLANQAVLPFEQFALGGIDTVRGYRQDTLLTDDGALLSAEVRLPILRMPKINGILQFAPFVDAGFGWNLSGRPDPDPQFLVGVGAGLRLQIGNAVTARFDYGIPLTEVSGEKNTLQEQGFYFSLIVNPFAF